MYPALFKDAINKNKKALVADTGKPKNAIYKKINPIDKISPSISKNLLKKEVKSK